tara:strand:+ start:409 stop:663 length:255 start_codon:yes stop_codon:yes gene_type:complete
MSIDFPHWIQVNESLITFKSSGTLPDGVGYITIDISQAEYAHIAYLQSPMALVYNGVVYGRSSYNSDKMEVVYRTDKPTATAIR